MQNKIEPNTINTNKPRLFETVPKNPEPSPWKVIIADDEEEVHSVTRLVLDDFKYEDRKLNFISAYTGEETCRLIRENPDTALILLDVVMETEHAGLDAVKYIRDTLKNSFVRIILRTGQPGQAPERKVVSTYDINDYKDKTELTSDRLYTTIMASLRSYRDLQRIERNRKSLEHIVATSPKMLGYQSQKQLGQEVLNQLISLVSIENGAGKDTNSALFVTGNENKYSCLASSGLFKPYKQSMRNDPIFENTNRFIQNAFLHKQSIFDHNTYTGFFETVNGKQFVFHLQSSRKLDEQDTELISLFISTASAAFENIQLNKEIEATHKEIIDTLGEMIESRFTEMGNHVKRVAAYAQVLALKAGMSQQDAEVLRFASPMHDIGKIGIPDVILKKPGRLTHSEYEIMKQHTQIGFNILKSSDRPILKCAATIALQHHERWDGKGYPQGLKGEDIHVVARIIRLVDVFDALHNKRIYKKPWQVENIIEYFIQERGKQFDPGLVDLFVSSIDEFIAISDRYPDDSV